MKKMSFFIVQLQVLTSKTLLSHVVLTALTAIGDSHAALRMTKAAMSVAQKGLAFTAAQTAKAGLTAQTLLLDQPANELHLLLHLGLHWPKRYLSCPHQVERANSFISYQNYACMQYRLRIFFI